MRRLVGLSVCVVTLLLVVRSYGQPADLAILEQSMRQFEDPQTRTRRAAFYALRESRSVEDLLQQWPEKSDEIKRAFIKLLERENKVTKEHGDFILREYAKGKGPDMPHPFPEDAEDSEYYPTLIATVICLKDTRSLDALLGAITTGYMVTSALAEFGDAALDRVLEVSKSSDDVAKSAATGVLAQMLDGKLDARKVPRVSDSVSRQKIKDALLRAAGDGNRFIRSTGVEGLAKLGDPDVIPLIQKVATSDPVEQVRNAANEALKEPARDKDLSYAGPCSRGEHIERDGQ